jgi:hypothetical protein
MEPYGTVIFCDDIRFERQGTISLVGCYGGDLILPNGFPSVLPKLCLFIQIRMPIETDSSSQLVIRVFAPGDPDKPLFEQVAPPLPNATAMPPDTGDGDPDIQKVIGMSYPIIISPFPVQRAGNVKVRVMLGGKTIKVGALKISQATPQQMVSLFSPTF